MGNTGSSQHSENVVARERLGEAQVGVIEEAWALTSSQGRMSHLVFYRKMIECTVPWLPSALERALFRILDRDHDGWITADDLICGLAVLREGTFTEHVQLLHRFYTHAGNGSVTCGSLRAAAGWLGDERCPEGSPKEAVSAERFAEWLAAHPDSLLYTWLGFLRERFCRPPMLEPCYRTLLPCRVASASQSAGDVRDLLAPAAAFLPEPAARSVADAHAALREWSATGTVDAATLAARLAGVVPPDLPGRVVALYDRSGSRTLSAAEFARGFALLSDAYRRVTGPACGAEPGGHSLFTPAPVCELPSGGDVGGGNRRERGGGYQQAAPGGGPVERLWGVATTGVTPSPGVPADGARAPASPSGGETEAAVNSKRSFHGGAAAERVDAGSEAANGTSGSEEANGPSSSEEAANGMNGGEEAANDPKLRSETAHEADLAEQPRSVGSSSTRLAPSEGVDSPCEQQGGQGGHERGASDRAQFAETEGKVDQGCCMRGAANAQRGGGAAPAADAETAEEARKAEDIVRDVIDLVEAGTVQLLLSTVRASLFVRPPTVEEEHDLISALHPRFSPHTTNPPGTQWHLIDKEWFDSWQAAAAGPHDSSLSWGSRGQRAADDAPPAPGSVGPLVVPAVKDAHAPEITPPGTGLAPAYQSKYAVVNKRAYEALAAWYGVKDDRKPVVRTVLSDGCLEVQMTEVLVVKRSLSCVGVDPREMEGGFQEPMHWRKLRFSAESTLAEVKGEAAEEFDIDAKLAVLATADAAIVEDTLLLGELPGPHRFLISQDPQIYEPADPLLCIATPVEYHPPQPGGAQSPEVSTGVIIAVGSSTVTVRPASSDTKHHEVPKEWIIRSLRDEPASPVSVFSTLCVNPWLSASPVINSPTRGLVGMTNLGNTCFMNASIQGLSHTKLIREYFLKSDYLYDVSRGKPGTGGRLSLAFEELLMSLWGSAGGAAGGKNQIRVVKGGPPEPPQGGGGPGSRGAPDLRGRGGAASFAGEAAAVVDTACFRTAVGSFFPNFPLGAQHDAHEFLVALISKLSDDLNRQAKHPANPRTRRAAAPKKRQHQPSDPRSPSHASRDTRRSSASETETHDDGDLPSDHNPGGSSQGLADSQRKDAGEPQPAGEAMSAAWRRYVRAQNSVFTHVFGGVLESTLRCCGCGGESSSHEPFTFLSLSIPHADKIVANAVLQRPQPTGEPYTRVAVKVKRTGIVADLLDEILLKYPKDLPNRANPAGPATTPPRSSYGLVACEVMGPNLHSVLSPTAALSNLSTTPTVFYVPANAEVTIRVVHRRFGRAGGEEAFLGGFWWTLFDKPLIVGAAARVAGKRLKRIIWAKCRHLVPDYPEAGGIPFAVSTTTRTGGRCATCLWDRSCYGCVVEDEEIVNFTDGCTVALTWDGAVLEEYYKPAWSSRIAEDESLQSCVVDVSCTLEDALKTFVATEHLVRTCPTCKKNDEQRRATFTQQASVTTRDLFIPIAVYLPQHPATPLSPSPSQSQSQSLPRSPTTDPPEPPGAAVSARALLQEICDARQLKPEDHMLVDAEALQNGASSLVVPLDTPVSVLGARPSVISSKCVVPVLVECRLTGNFVLPLQPDPAADDPGAVALAGAELQRVVWGLRQRFFTKHKPATAADTFPFTIHAYTACLDPDREERRSRVGSPTSPKDDDDHMPRSIASGSFNSATASSDGIRVKPGTFIILRTNSVLKLDWNAAARSVFEPLKSPVAERRDKATKSLTIAKHPPVLLIHLKRFCFNGYTSTKLDTLVTAPLTGLRIDEFTYRLFAVVNHTGSTTAGHYFTFVLHEGKWWALNDANVYPVLEEDVITNRAYILLYERDDCAEQTIGEIFPRVNATARSKAEIAAGAPWNCSVM
ncbi:Ubiquitin carboxyl-terminal hydrolase 8 [Diplonema papillatum]|nr:Ubiquitin carboxyl-terminal hydrolase 8 [Diplonema papillatum]